MNFPILEVENFTALISNQKITHIDSLRIEEGELISLVGPNGSGKTSFIQCCAGIIPHITGGTILGTMKIFDTPLSSATTNFLRGKVNYVPSAIDMFFVCEYLYEELLFTLAGVHDEEYTFLDNRVKAAISKFQLEGLERKPFSELSYGQRARCAVACAVVSQPQLILLDEVMSSLDNASRMHIEASIKSFVESGGTCIVADHDFEWAQGRKVHFYSEPSPESLDDTDEIDLEKWAHKDGLLVALSGDNGSGKTTILRHLAGFVDKKDIHDLNLSAIEKIVEHLPENNPVISYMPQESHYMFRSLRFSDDLQLTAINPSTTMKKMRLGYLAESNPKTFSYGEQKRAALALTISSAADVFLLDEPTRGLDKETKRQIISHLNEFCFQNNIVVVCATHDSELINACDLQINLRKHQDNKILVGAK